MRMIKEWKSYKSFGLKGSDAVEEHVQRTWEEATFPRWTSHSKGLTTPSNTIRKQQTYKQATSQCQTFICREKNYVSSKESNIHKLWLWINYQMGSFRNIVTAIVLCLQTVCAYAVLLPQALPLLLLQTYSKQLTAPGNTFNRSLEFWNHKIAAHISSGSNSSKHSVQRFVFLTGRPASGRVLYSAFVHLEQLVFLLIL